MSEVNETEKRARILARARVLLEDIEQIFTDCDSWNDNARPPGEPRVDPDPGGMLRRTADGLYRMLSAEESRR